MDYHIVLRFCIILVAISDQDYVISLRFEESDTEGLDIVQQFCPVQCMTETFQNEHNFDQDENSCCIPCDCTVSCVAAGTCCPDMETDNIHVTLESEDEMCVRTAVGASMEKSVIIDLDTYMLIQVCSSGAIQNISYDVIAKCLQPDENVLDELVPVYSNITERNYRNSFCAMCNGDSSSIVPWKSQLTCDVFEKAALIFPWAEENSTNETALQNLRNMEGCIIQWKPGNIKVSHCIDQDAVISECSDFKNTPELEKLCPEIYSPVKGFAGLYKNVFCLRCNEGDSVADFLCKNSITLVNQRTFSLFLGPEAYLLHHDMDQEPRSFNCLNEMTYDFNLKRCILKRCPISQMKVGDRCLPVLQEVKGVSLDYRFKLIYQLESFSLPPKDQVMSEIRHLVIHDDDSDLLCAEDILGIETEGGTVILRIKLTKYMLSIHIPNFDKSYDIYEDFQTVQGNVEIMNALAAEGAFAYTVEMYDSPFRPILSVSVNLVEYSDYDYSDACGKTIAVSSMQFCNTVLVRDYDLMEDGEVLVDGYIPFSPSEYIPSFKNERMRAMNQTSIIVCYDLYLSRGADSIYTSGSNVANIAFTSNLMKALILLTSLLFIILKQ